MNSTLPVHDQLEALNGILQRQLHDLKMQSAPGLLDTDVVKGTLRELYRVLDLLHREQTPPPTLEQPTTFRPEPVKEVSLQPAANSQIPVTTTSYTAPATEEITDPIPTPLSQPAVEIVENHPPSAEIMPRVSEQVTQDLHTTRKTVYTETIAKSVQGSNGPATLGSRYAAEESLSDRIAQAGQPERLSDQLQHKPLEDLRVSIGLNERFAFINSLFGGNQQSFYAAVDQLNGAGSYKDAQVKLDHLVATYGWESNHQQFVEFTELVKRRYGI